MIIGIWRKPSYCYQSFLPILPFFFHAFIDKALGNEWDLQYSHGIVYHCYLWGSNHHTECKIHIYIYSLGGVADSLVFRPTAFELEGRYNSHLDILASCTVLFLVALARKWVPHSIEVWGWWGSKRGNGHHPHKNWFPLTGKSLFLYVY